jgi:hypothetical protein
MHSGEVLKQAQYTLEQSVAKLFETLLAVSAISGSQETLSSTPGRKTKEHPCSRMLFCPNSVISWSVPQAGVRKAEMLIFLVSHSKVQQGVNAIIK